MKNDVSSPAFQKMICSVKLELSEAGYALAKIPRNQKRQWTGWLGLHHLRKGDLVVTPDGLTRVVYGAYRNQIIVWKNAVPLDGGLPADVYQGEDVERYKNPAAVKLGSAKKGVKERSSPQKKETCRRNANLPSKPGHKPRGRPATAIGNLNDLA